jgi:hypothetical protein
VPTARPATAEQRETVARLLAEGSTLAAACRAVGVSDRTGRRWRQEADFRALVTRAERAIETTAHDRERSRARRAGLPAPTTPAAVREQRQIMEEVAAQAQQQAHATRFQRGPATDADVVAWVLEQPLNHEHDFLDLHDAECGVASKRARARFEGEQLVRRLPQVRIWTVPRPAEQAGFGLPGSDIPVFAGMYGGSDAR